QADAFLPTKNWEETMTIPRTFFDSQNKARDVNRRTLLKGTAALAATAATATAASAATVAPLGQTGAPTELTPPLPLGPLPGGPLSRFSSGDCQEAVQTLVRA